MYPKISLTGRDHQGALAVDNCEALNVTLEDNDARVLTPKEAAALLSISYATLKRNVQHLPARVQLSQRRFGYRLGDLKSWLDRQTAHV